MKSEFQITMVRGNWAPLLFYLLMAIGKCECPSDCKDSLSPKCFLKNQKQLKYDSFVTLLLHFSVDQKSSYLTTLFLFFTIHLMQSYNPIKCTQGIIMVSSEVRRLSDSSVTLINKMKTIISAEISIIELQKCFL